jgi:hypothetical protein
MANRETPLTIRHSRFASFYHFSPNGRISNSNVQALFGCWYNCQYEAATEAGGISKSGLSSASLPQSFSRRGGESLRDLAPDIVAGTDHRAAGVSFLHVGSPLE